MGRRLLRVGVRLRTGSEGSDRKANAVHASERVEQQRIGDTTAAKTLQSSETRHEPLATRAAVTRGHARNERRMNGAQALAAVRQISVSVACEAAAERLQRACSAAPGQIFRGTVCAAHAVSGPCSLLSKLQLHGNLCCFASGVLHCPCYISPIAKPYLRTGARSPCRYCTFPAASILHLCAVRTNFRYSRGKHAALTSPVSLTNFSTSVSNQLIPRECRLSWPFIACGGVICATKPRSYSANVVLSHFETNFLSPPLDLRVASPSPRTRCDLIRALEILVQCGTSLHIAATPG